MFLINEQGNNWEKGSERDVHAAHLIRVKCVPSQIIQIRFKGALPGRRRVLGSSAIDGTSRFLGNRRHNFSSSEVTGPGTVASCAISCAGNLWTICFYTILLSSLCGDEGKFMWKLSDGVRLVTSEPATHVPVKRALPHKPLLGLTLLS